MLKQVCKTLFRFIWLSGNHPYTIEWIDHFAGVFYRLIDEFASLLLVRKTNDVSIAKIVIDI